MSVSSVNRHQHIFISLLPSRGVERAEIFSSDLPSPDLSQSGILKIWIRDHVYLAVVQVRVTERGRTEFSDH